MSLEGFKKAFEGFDVNDLDFATAGHWPIGVKVVNYLLAFSIVLGLGIYFYLLDSSDRLDRVMREEASLKQSFEQKAGEVANLEALRQQMADVEERFSELLRQLPSQNEVPGLLDDITAIGRASGLDIRLIELQPEQKSQFYIELPINITVAGTYHQMGEFVSGVAAISRIVTLHDYQIAPSQNSDKLVMNIRAKTYRYDEQE